MTFSMGYNDSVEAPPPLTEAGESKTVKITKSLDGDWIFIR